MGKTAYFPALTYLKNTLFGIVKQLARIKLIVVDVLDYVLRGRHQGSRVIPLLDYRDICKHICDRRNILNKLGEIGLAARLVVYSVIFQLFKQRYKVYCLAQLIH